MNEEPRGAGVQQVLGRLDVGAWKRTIYSQALEIAQSFKASVRIFAKLSSKNAATTQD